MKAFATLLGCALVLVSCAAPADAERTCSSFGGMEVRVCEYEVDELMELHGSQGVMLLGWLREDNGELYLEGDNGARVPINTIREAGFAQIRDQMVGRYVRATGLYLPGHGLDLVSIRYRRSPDEQAPPPLRGSEIATEAQHSG